MCYCESNIFDREELASLGWNEIVEAPPTYEQLANQYFNYQWLTYTELFQLVEDGVFREGITRLAKPWQAGPTHVGGTST